MLQKILNRLGYITKTESALLRAENFSLREDVKKTRENSDYLMDVIKTMRQKRVVDTNVGDPAPEDPTARREYVARVAAFHTDVLSPKIYAMVAEVRAELEKIDNSPELDRILKGTSNALWLMHSWGELMVSEMMSYRTDN